MKARKINILLATMALSMAVAATGCGAKKDHTESVQATEAVEAVVETETEEATETETEEVTEEPAEAVTEEPAEVSDGYTYEEMDSTMYASSKVNVRSTPSQDGEKLGTLKKGEEVKVTGKCAETGWFRIAYGNGNGFVSDKYVTETAASGTTNSASSSKDGKKDSKSNGTASSTSGKQQNTGSTATSGQSTGTTTGTTTGGKTNSSATSGSNSSNSNNNQNANNNSGNGGSSNNGNSGNSNTGNSGSNNNGGSSNNGNSGNSGSTSGLPSLEEAEKNANGGALAPGQYVDKDGKVWEVAPTQPADTENNDVSFGDSSNWDNFGENVPENP